MPILISSYEIKGHWKVPLPFFINSDCNDFIMLRAYKFRLYPNRSQKAEMYAHLFLSKNLWNDGLELAKQLYKDYQMFPTRQVYQEICKNSGLYSQVAQDVLLRLDHSVRAKIRGKNAGLKVGFPRFKSIGRVKSIHYPQFGFSLSERKLKLTPFGEINIKKHREIQGKIKTLTLKRESTGKWFAIFLVEMESIHNLIKERNEVGADLGLLTFATLSNGIQIKKPGHLKKYEVELISRQRKLSNKRPRSKNRGRERINVARVYSKIVNIRKDWLHKTANGLLSHYSLIALEKLEVKTIAKEHGKGVSDVCWSTFTNILGYKAESAGCQVIFVNPENTSKECSSCGILVDKSLRERQHICPFCDLSIDRDLNAAINILKRAREGISRSNACGEEPSAHYKHNEQVFSVKQESHGFSRG